MKSIRLILSGAQLSDLFFNYEHPNRDQIYKDYASKKDSPTKAELTGAALADAFAFVESYQVPIDPGTLAADFLRRA